MSSQEVSAPNNADPLAYKMEEFFRAAGGLVVANGLEGLANVVGGYASYQPEIPDDVKTAMLIFEGAIRQRIQAEHQDPQL